MYRGIMDILDALRFFASMEGTAFRDIPDDMKAWFLELKHMGLVVAAFPDAVVRLTIEGQMLLAEDDKRRKAQEQQEAKEREQQALDAQERAKAARKDFWHKAWKKVGWALIVPALTFAGDKILGCLRDVVPKVAAFFKELFQQIHP